MLFDPRVLVEQPVQVLAVLGIIVLGKSRRVVRRAALLGDPARIAATVARGLAQIGEFSFILLALGGSLGLIDRDTQALVVGASLLSITINQPLQGWLQRLLARYAPGIPESLTEGDAFDLGAVSNHVILVGYGRWARRSPRRSTARASRTSSSRSSHASWRDCGCAASRRSPATRRAPTC